MVMVPAPLSLLPSNELWRRRRGDTADLRVVSVVRVPVIVILSIFSMRVVSVGWRRRPSVVIILLVQLYLSKALASLLLLVLNVHLSPLVAPPPHLLGLSHPSLPGTLVLRNRGQHHHGLILPHHINILSTLSRQDGAGSSEHGVVSLVQDSRMEEPAATAPGTLTFREESTHSLRFQPLILQGLVLVRYFTILKLLTRFYFFSIF